MKKKYFICAVFIVSLQFIAFFFMVIPFATVKNMYEWNDYRFFNVLKFNVRSALHTIATDWCEWRKY